MYFFFVYAPVSRDVNKLKYKGHNDTEKGGIYKTLSIPYANSVWHMSDEFVNVGDTML